MGGPLRGSQHIHLILNHVGHGYDPLGFPISSPISPESDICFFHHAVAVSAARAGMRFVIDRRPGRHEPPQPLAVVCSPRHKLKENLGQERQRRGTQLLLSFAIDAIIRPYQFDCVLRVLVVAQTGVGRRKIKK